MFASIDLYQCAMLAIVANLLVREALRGGSDEAGLLRQ
jgi:hypothetical protein